MYSDVMVEAMIQTRERERMQHVAEGRVRQEFATLVYAVAARPAPPKPAIDHWFGWLQRRAPRTAAAPA